MNKLILGIGTGRCGSHTLHHILNSQNDTSISHEFGNISFLPWNFDRLAYERAKKVITRRVGRFTGDVSHYLLKYIPYFIDDFGMDSTRIICLWRSREDVVRSFSTWTEGKNHWSNDSKNSSTWDKCFPKYDSSTKEEAIGFYWDDYYKEVDSLAKKYSIFFMRTEDLNSPEQVKSMLEFCGFPNPDVISGIRLNGSQ